jgi:murein DD-endopeptidase MepM/ murein hydrolase activator NlpD
MTSGQSRIGSTTRLAAPIAKGDQRRLRVHPKLIVPLLAALVLLAAWYFVATVYLIFRDDLLARLIARQTEMQYAYEDRVSALRAQIDRITSRQLVDQDSIEGRVHELLGRQARLETRNAMVLALAEYTGPAPARAVPATADDLSAKDATAAIPATTSKGAPAPRAKASANAKLPPSIGSALKAPPAVPDAVSAFAPLETMPKPRLAPEALQLRGLTGGAEPTPLSREPQRSSMLDWDSSQALQSLPLTLRALTSRLNIMEATQVASLRDMDRRTRARALQLHAVVADLGIDMTKLQAAGAPPQGGPFVPLPMDAAAGPFEGMVDRLQKAVVEMERINRVIAVLPLRKPLPGDPEITSGFGYRVDPFNRGAAMHTGIDFRDDYGAPVRATAGGRVITAEPSGGYGNLVEIDHGNGMTTRYAHLSAITVDAGQNVAAGAVVGRLGSTGRSTGPHLHYETRVDGEAVDPLRYLRAASRLTRLQN